MHYSVIIISNNYEIKNSNFLVINSPIELVDDCILIYNKERITFDYLIITNIVNVSNLKSIGILTENKIPIVNYQKQTSIENIYYCLDNEIDEIINEL